MIKAIIAFVLLFTLDNLLVIFFPIQPIFGNYLVVPYLLLIGLCIYTFYDEKNYSFWLAIVFGLIYDIFATNLLGLYIIMFPTMVMLIKKRLVEVTPVNFISIFYVSTVAILAVEIIVYTFVRIITARNMTLLEFAQYRLFITLIFNTFLLLIFYLPLVKFLQPKSEKKVKTIMMDNTAA